MAGFPRFSGFLLLVASLSVVVWAFDRSLFGDALRSGSLAASSPALLNGAVAASSLLNVLSHSAVVLGALDDAYVLSILLGVGFDVLTRVVVLIWWTVLNVIALREHEANDDVWNRGFFEACPVLLRECGGTIVFSAFLLIMHVYHIVMHVHALQMSHHSFETVVLILRAALNNLRGVPGKGYEDHLFAYSDLVGHMAPFLLSYYLLQQQRALLVGVQIISSLAFAFAIVLRMVPITHHQRGEDALLFEVKNGRIGCRCRACAIRFMATGKINSFTFTTKEGVCCLWLDSFGGLLDKLSKQSSM